MSHELKTPQALALAVPRAIRVALDDGSFILRSPEPLRPYARCVGEWVERWARETPDDPAVSERAADGSWKTLGWAQLRELVGRIAQSLLGLKLPAHDPIVILSDNSTEHLLLMLAAMHIGRTVCTVSSAYCRQTQDYSKVHGILNTLGPSLVYASQAQVYGPAIQSAGLGAVVVFSEGAESFPGALAFDTLCRTAEGPAVMAAFDAITPDTHAKYLLTSGSTGHPKVVINTHRMLCANQQSMAQVWKFMDEEKPVLVDWLPWSHTFGGNHNVNLILRTGGTLVIDNGRPVPGLIEKTVANLAHWQPTAWFNVPRGFDMALPLLEADDELARRVLGRLRMVFYAGAALSQATWDRLQALALRVRGEKIWLTTSWGATETAPAITSAHWTLDRAGVIGAVLPGLELKFVTNGSKQELRVRGVSVFPGYRNAPHLTAQAFDEEGYYCIGDAGYLLDEDHPERGVVFNGRVAEDFKLSSGTWVSVGTLRVRVVAALSPYVQDAVITGHDREDVGVLLFLTAEGAKLAPQALAQALRQGFATLGAGGGGSSQVPRRARVLTEPPSVDAGEITDKGYINQSAVLRRRAAEVEALYAGATGTHLFA